MTRGPIMIMAGGTGGHVFPGLAVAEALRARSRSVVWLGTRRGLEARVVPARGIDIEWITIAGVRGRGVLAWLAAPFKILRAFAQALGALRRRRPAAVLGMGGFVAGPGGVAAWLTRRPLLLHEQNAVAGTTNRLLAPLATRIFAAFPGSFPGRRDDEVIGNPVRATIVASDSPRERLRARAHSRRRLLVVGGSLGARILNETLPRALAEIPAEQRPEVWHQAGPLGLEDARKAYADAGVAARVEPFIDDVASAYRWADLVVARAGGITLAELAIVGVGAILVPFRAAIDDHQTRNAEHFTRAGAGLKFAELELSPSALARALLDCLGDFERLVGYAEAARAQAHADAAERLAAACVTAAEARA
ncbi:MAG TPA: undecaprenyldiphospho-muramoylpentapeptide beta-N-acetylglucosaminyltransferase [Gammaproteobacteria bacterium]|jgi:UDP-N-acetylglucosamine--N-acetylmuramyl-(pentapeptide) pyrophosphoryl-undecaprenol N-acetylglucosamine transferase|nr:undecaprenyldiphospho-muramoylpentapeptide beta-N-acetylglucosaminyltransferase [Gammaproteobacteria bacterium]